MPGATPILKVLKNLRNESSAFSLQTAVYRVAHMTM